MGWRWVIERLLGVSPACPHCGGPTGVVGEELVHMMPPVLELRYRCQRCDEELVSWDVVDVWG